MTEAACSEKCSRDCSCVGFAYNTDGSAHCWLKHQSLVNGRSIPSDFMTKFPVKIASSQVLPPSRLTTSTDQGLPSIGTPLKSIQSNTSIIVQSNHTSSNKDTVIAAVSSSAVTASVVFIFMCAVLVYSKRKLRIKGDASQGSSHVARPGSALRCFSYRELQTATRNFGEKLGSGGFGSVYKGFISELGHIAVKKLDKLNQGDHEFKTEVETIGRVHHINLVRLYGFCSKGSERLLVYEYLSNGSLDRFLFQPHDQAIAQEDTKLQELQQEQLQLHQTLRLQIAMGIARGIAYLHEECRESIIHCDIKPQNILLDDRFIPKVSDFGIAKLLQKDQTHTFTVMRGTRGYVAPEWFSNQPITVKADVYSYGMVLLELMAGRRNVEPTYSVVDFREWAFSEIKEGKLEGVVRDLLGPSGEEAHHGVVERMIKISFWCLQEEASARPSMGRVVQMLEGMADVPNFSRSMFRRPSANSGPSSIFPV